MNLRERRSAWRAIVASGRTPSLRVSLLSTFTIEPLVPYLGVAWDEAGTLSDIKVGPYNQIVQECLDGSSATSAFAPDVSVVWPRLEDLWRGLSIPKATTLEPDAYAADLLEIVDAAAAAAQRGGGTLVFVLPGIPEERPYGAGDAMLCGGVFATATRVREMARARLAACGALIVDAEEVVRKMGLRATTDRRLLALADIPFTEAFYHAVADGIVRARLAATRSEPAVLVVCDDGVLWHGSLAKLGPAGVGMSDRGPGQPYLALQRFLRELAATGLPLCLSSANAESLVDEAFVRPEALVDKGMFIARAYGPGTAEERLGVLARALGVERATMVLLVGAGEDAPAGVRALCVSSDGTDWWDVLGDSGVVDRLRGHSTPRASAPPPPVPGGEPLVGEHVRTLGISVDIRSATRSDAASLSTLFGRAKQFAIGGRTRDAADLERTCGNRDYIVRLVRAHQEGTELGLVGAYVVRLDARGAALESFALSRRALGRGIEVAMVADAFEQVAALGRSSFVAIVEPTGTNQPALAFFSRLGCAPGRDGSPILHVPWPLEIGRAASAPVEGGSATRP